MPPPKPVRLTWGPSDIRQRVTLGQVIDQAEARNASAQTAKEKVDQRKLTILQKKKEALQRRKDQLAEQKASAVTATAAAEERARAATIDYVLGHSGGEGRR